MPTGPFKPFAYPLPASAEEWNRTKNELRCKLWRLLGFEEESPTKKNDPLRSLEFLSWFGEWEISKKFDVGVIRIESDLFNQEISIKSMNNKMRNYAILNFPGTYNNTDTGWNILITGKGIRHALSGRQTRERMLVIPYLIDLVKNAIKIKTEPNAKGNPKILWVHHFIAVVRIYDFPLLTKLTVREFKTGEITLRDLTIIGKPPGISTVSGQTGLPRPSSGFSTLSIQELLKDIKQDFLPSKVVDEDGVPRLIYRKSENLFSTLIAGEPYFLSIKNPFISASEITEDILSQAQASGCDGVIQQTPKETIYAIFHEQQAKSAPQTPHKITNVSLQPIPKPRILFHEQRNGYILEKFEFENEIGDRVPGYIAIPSGLTQPAPAILYHHYHGDEYDNGKEEILKNYPIDKPPVESFTQAGYVVLAIDAYVFGERQHQGSAGERESGVKTESALFKEFIWKGKTLWGMMVRDDQLALNYLISRPEVDSRRIGATGMSMGSTRTWWLTALDERIRAAVCVCCLTRYQNLIQNGENNQHGIYYYVPNLLKEGIDMEAVIALIAPRPLLTQTGDRDGGSPIDGVNAINSFVEHVYGLYNASQSFHGAVYPGVGHQYTSDMWLKTINWFEKHLK